MKGRLNGTSPSGEFPRFPPGPRWFVALWVTPGEVRIDVQPGQQDSELPDLFEEPPDTVYVFVQEVTEEELSPVVSAMFNERGPSLSEVFADCIEGMLTPIPLQPGPGGVH